jgi:hypothetical protein
MFGDVKFHLNRFIVFNEGLERVFTNPDFKEDGTTVCCDVSGSMNSALSELKLCLSALGAMTGCKHELVVPYIRGMTSLADMADKVAKDLGPNEKFMILTDGEDTSSKGWTFADPPDEPECGSDTATWQSYYEQVQEWKEQRREAMIKYLEDVTQAEVFLLGIGKEVKDFIKTAAKAGRRCRVAHVSKGANVKQISSVVAACARAPRRKATEATTVITVDAPEAQVYVPTDEQAATVQANTAYVAIGSTALTPQSVKDYIERAESNINMSSVDKTKARAALLWFMDQQKKNGEPLAGALLSGKKAHVFADPGKPDNTGFHTYCAKLLSALDKQVLKQHPKMATTYSFEGQLFTYKDANTYSVLDTISTDVITVLLGEEGWAAKQCDLQKVAPKGQKRKAEEQLTKDASATVA